jgi:hypothetical protein
VLFRSQCQNLDITGGAPELNPNFDHFVIEARRLKKHVIVRHNLTVIFDGNPQTGEQKRYLPEFFADHQVEILASLPHYIRDFTDSVRGPGVFDKSIEGIRRLNDLGYGKGGGDLVFDHLALDPLPDHLLPLLQRPDPPHVDAAGGIELQGPAAGRRLRRAEHHPDLLAELVDEDDRGVASGINAALWRLPNALSTVIGAYLMANGLLAAPFFLASLLYAVSIGLFWSYFRKIRMPEEK